VRARAPLLPLLALLAAAQLAGCGNERASPPPLGRPEMPLDYEIFTSAGGEVSFKRPTNWELVAGHAPELVRMYSGSALVAIYSYPGRGLPTSQPGLEASRRRLLASLQRRDPSLRVLRSRIGEVDGSPAVEVDARATIGRRRVVERSIHVYKPGGEYVIDAYAAPAVFLLAERWGFRPLVESISLAESAEG
jgi:hypothetical protein